MKYLILVLEFIAPVFMIIVCLWVVWFLGSGKWANW
jgi:hypothetical protein